MENQIKTKYSVGQKIRLKDFVDCWGVITEVEPCISFGNHLETLDVYTIHFNNCSGFAAEMFQGKTDKYKSIYLTKYKYRG